MANKNVIVVGGGLAGLAAAVRLAETGTHVDLFSVVPVKRSHSVCAQGGINAAKNTKGEGDSPWQHLDDTCYGGDFLANQPPVWEMCQWAPRIIDLLDRMGVMFNRTQEGLLDFRRFGGTLHHRTAFAGATTGQQLLYALDEQTRRWEVEGRVTKFEFWEFLAPVLDDKGACRGIVAQNLITLEMRAFRADAVILATGGCGVLFGSYTTNSVICNGAAASRVVQAGGVYANGEFVQVHPTAIPGRDKCRLMSESARGEGGRVWVPKDKNDTRDPREIPESERWYFLEERYPKYGNLVPRDIATREIFDVCKEGFGLGGQQMVYLDLTHIDRGELDRKLFGILEIYEKFVGDDPRDMPMKIFPAVHYSMGGLWVDFEKDNDTGGLVADSVRNQSTNIPGLYAIGELDYQYHGANRLGANSLLSCIFAGLFIGPGVENYIQNQTTAAADVPGSQFDAVVQQQQSLQDELLGGDGGENPYVLHRELGSWMSLNCTVVRNNDELSRTLDRIDQLQERSQRMTLSDGGQWHNQTLSYARALKDMMILAKIIVSGALAREESRGAHYKPNTPSRTDETWLKTTRACVNADGTIALDYEPVDTSLVPPRERSYGKK